MGTATEMIVENVGCLGCNLYSKQVLSDINTGDTYFIGTTCVLTGLAANTTTYYRAYAHNDCGYGYGTICCALTDEEPPIQVYFGNACVHTLNDTCVRYSAEIVLSQPLIAGQSFRVNYRNGAYVRVYGIGWNPTMCSYSYRCYGTSRYDCAQARLYEGISSTVCDTDSGYFDVTHLTNLSAHRFILSTCIDFSTPMDYRTYACSEITSLSQQQGGCFLLDGNRDCIIACLCEGDYCNFYPPVI